MALSLACRRLQAEGRLERSPLTGALAAVSCGIIDGTPLLDLDYSEDSTAEVDANVVMTGDGGLVEVQATAERTPLSRAHLDELLALAAGGIERLRAAQEQAIAAAALKLLLATHSQHKRREFERLLKDSTAGAWQIDPLPESVPLPPEDGETFAENAVGKARAAALATGTVSIADDSGIAAAALDGAPGVRSARYAGEHASDAENLEKLLREAPPNSALEYVCVIAYVDPASCVERVFEGRCTGRLAAQPARRAGFRLRPGVRCRRRSGGDDDGRAQRSAEGRHQPSRPCGQGAAGMARGRRRG